MRVQDQVVLALCIWRENRGHGREGMQSVANVILNRAAKDGSTAYAEVVKPLQFSSMTAKGDPELALWPADNDQSWDAALDIAELAAAGVLQDITNGALLYYAPHALDPTKTKPYTWLDGSTIPFPETWNANVVKPLCSIGGQVFFR